MISKIYDPMGTISSFVIKLFMQKLCEHGIDWNYDLPYIVREKFKNWYAKIKSLQNYEISISRRYFVNILKLDF